ncbi:CPBP family intramembrane metalloprotease [Cohnella xylanilytica]|uniref:CPBP family intramembrane metalloprotease n=2 Tax=Cohnella xylanilytica TaxID=557555 RepID=A0A841TTZ6_9BACL|nr:CPBP family intramembrane metalloprotease [Cohnella xylanilytica]
MFSMRWFVISCVGFLVFLWAQIFPGIAAVADPSANPRVLDRASARNLALAAAADRFDVAATDVVKLDLTHFSDGDAVGYFSKRKLSDEYDRSWEESFPTDVYRADLKLVTGDWLQLSLHMKSGKLVAWKRLESSGGVAAGAKDKASRVREAWAELGRWGYSESDWELADPSAADGSTVFQSRKPPLGEARLQLAVKPGEQLVYRFSLPQAYTDYIEHQQRLATRMSTIGYVLPEIVLFVLAIVYASSYSRHTSFKRGWFLALLFFVLYVCFTLNMKAGFRSKSETGLPVNEHGVQSLIVVNAVILGATALLTYFAAVGGDGLWRSMGRKLWPRWQEADYGFKVVRSMTQGYALAFVVLGAQSVILLALEPLLGSFVSSDASQSSYNLTYPWLMPVIAWCAGLSEELLYRLFGIGLFRRWLTGAARLLLRREPSRRTAAILTFAAMIPPSVIWSFGHVGYPIYPVYTRVIELTVLGLLFGWFMLRFGLMTAIFAHVTLDAVLVGSQLLFDGLPYDAYSGLFSFAMPALAGAAIWLLHRGSAGGGRARTAQPGN